MGAAKRTVPTLPISIETLDKEHGKLSSDPERLNFETQWQNGADMCNPADSDIKREQTGGGRKVPKRVTDVCIEACRTFMKGMYSFSVGTGSFFNVTINDHDLLKKAEVKAWLAECTRRMLYELRGSNFEAEAMQTFFEMGYIGTALTASEWLDGGLNFRTQHISQYWISVDAKNRVNKVFCMKQLTADQIDEEYYLGEIPSPFPKPDEIADAVSSGMGNKMFDVIQACCKNPNFKAKSLLPEEKRFISTYYLRGLKKPLLIDGHDTFPFHTARLYKSKNETYGRSCFMDCEKTAYLLNDERITIIRGGKNRADPPWIEAADARTRHIRTNEIHKVIYDPTSLGGAPVQADIKGDVGITERMIEIDTEIIDRAFYKNSFNPLLGLKNMSATEAIERLNMGLSETTPMAVKWYREYLVGLLRRSYGLLDQKGRLPEPPDSLNGTKLEFEFVSKAALALLQLESYGVMEAYEKIALISDRQPEVLDNVNVDAMANIITDAANVTTLMLNSEKEVKSTRAVRAQQQADAKELEAAPVVADAASKLAGINPEQQ